jgi:hypothetical protein
MELAWHLVKGGHADTIRASDGERIDGRQAAQFAAEVQGRQFIRIVASGESHLEFGGDIGWVLRFG